MNVNTGELRRFQESLSMDERKAFFGDFTEVPEKLQAEADKELGDKDSTFVDLKADSPLANWAKSERNKPHPDGNRKHRRKMAKESRKKNR